MKTKCFLNLTLLSLLAPLFGICCILTEKHFPAMRIDANSESTLREDICKYFPRNKASADSHFPVTLIDPNTRLPVDQRRVKEDVIAESASPPTRIAVDRIVCMPLKWLSEDAPILGTKPHGQFRDAGNRFIQMKK